MLKARVIYAPRGRRSCSEHFAGGNINYTSNPTASEHDSNYKLPGASTASSVLVRWKENEVTVMRYTGTCNLILNTSHLRMRQL